MEVNLQKIKIDTVWSIGFLIIFLFAIDLVMRIYLNYHQIKYYKNENGGGMNKHGI